MALADRLTFPGRPVCQGGAGLSEDLTLDPEKPLQTWGEGGGRFQTILYSNTPILLRPDLLPT